MERQEPQEVLILATYNCRGTLYKEELMKWEKEAREVVDAIPIHDVIKNSPTTKAMIALGSSLNHVTPIQKEGLQMRYPVCTKLGKTLTCVVSLLTAVCCTAPVNAHTLWIQSVEHNINQGQRNTMFMGWGHHLPVHDMLSTSWVKGFTIHEPDGERIEKKFSEDQKGYMTTPIVYTKEGTYRLSSQVVPGYYTVYIKEGDTHPHHHFGPKDTIEGDVSRIPMSLFYEMYTKCVITVGKQNGMANKPIGQRMEVILDKDPTEYRAGDTVNFTVLWEGKPLEHRALFYVMPQGESPYFDDFKYNKVPLQGGKGSFKITRPGIWYIKTAFTLNPSGDKVGKCNDMAYTATLTVQVDVEGDFPRPGFSF